MHVHLGLARMHILLLYALMVEQPTQHQQGAVVLLYQRDSACLLSMSAGQSLCTFELSGPKMSTLE